MALDEDGEKAVELLLSLKDAGRLLNNSELKDNWRDIKAFLRQRVSRLDETEYAAVVAEAKTQMLALRAAKAAAVSSGGSKPAIPHPSGIEIDTISAPYRFITLPDEVAAAQPETLAARDEPLEHGFCASIDVEWIAETPLLIGGPSAGKAGGNDVAVMPLKINQTYAIPGATLRGLIRSAVEILSYSKLTQANLHHRFGLRDFDHERYGEKGSVTSADHVRAGFLKIRKALPSDPSDCVTETDEVFLITPAQEWHRVSIDSLGELDVPGHMVQEWSKTSLKDKYRALGMWDGKRPVFAFHHLPRFSFVREDNDGQQIFRADKNGLTEAMFVGSGPVPGGGNKRFDYIVVPNGSASPVPVPSDQSELFERMYSEPSKGNRRVPTGSWKVLAPVARAGGIPVFYVGDPSKPDSEFFFGLTRLFKLPHEFSIGEVLHRTQPKHKPLAATEPEPGRDGPYLKTYENVDFAESLFGYVMEPGDLGFKPDSVAPGALARKGRIAFGYAFVDPATQAIAAPPEKVIQMAPRASFAPFYLRSAPNGVKDWSSTASRLAGRKAYLPRFAGPVSPEAALESFRAFADKQIQDMGRDANKDTVSRLGFLVPKGTQPLCFQNRITLENVTAEEIGAVLYAVTHGGDDKRRFRHMIGRGKPFGAGQVRIGRLSLRVDPNGPKGAALCCAPQPDELFKDDSGHGWLKEGDASLTPFLAAFETMMRRATGRATYPLVEPVQEWLGMADPKHGAEQTNRLLYKPLPSRPNRSYTLFTAFKALRQATQANLKKEYDPLGPERLLPAPESDPPRKPPRK